MDGKIADDLFEETLAAQTIQKAAIYVSWVAPTIGRMCAATAIDSARPIVGAP
jgi:hypothetical protein